MCTSLAKEVGDGPTTVDVVSWFSRTALELMGRGGLGQSFDSLANNQRNKYGDDLQALM